MKRFSLTPFIWITCSIAWVGALAWLMVTDTILRETRLGFVARFLDGLPSRISSPVFLLLWLLFLLGWCVPLFIGLRGLRVGRAG